MDNIMLISQCVCNSKVLLYVHKRRKMMLAHCLYTTSIIIVKKIFFFTQLYVAKAT